MKTFHLGRFLLVWLVGLMTAVGLTSLWYWAMWAIVVYCHDPNGTALELGMSMGLIVPIGLTVALMGTALTEAEVKKT